MTMNSTVVAMASHQSMWTSITHTHTLTVTVTDRNNGR